MPKLEELIGEYDYTANLYQAGNNDDGLPEIKVAPGKLVDGTLVVGRCLASELQTGLTYLFRGKWVDYKGVKQFQFSSVGIHQPSGKRGTVNYLQRADGIGAKRAEKIWEIYGQDSLEAIRERPEEVAAKVQGLKVEDAKEAAKLFKQHLQKEKLYQELEEIRISGRLQQAVINAWGAAAPAKIKQNAFLLMRIRDFGFAKADKLFLQLGGSPEHPLRVAWCCWNAIHRDRNGHTWCKPAVCLADVSAKVSIGQELVFAGIDFAIDNGILVLRGDDNSGAFLSTNNREYEERRLAIALCKAIEDGGETLKIGSRMNIWETVEKPAAAAVSLPPDDEQSKQVRRAIVRRRIPEIVK